MAESEDEEVVFTLQDNVTEHVQKHDEEPDCAPDLTEDANDALNKPLRLNLRYFNIAPQPLNKDLITLCPTTDVLALAVSSKSVEIVRIDGQHISTTARPASAATVTRLEWTPAGRVLLVLWSDDLVQSTLPARKGHVVDATKLVPAFGNADESSISCISCTQTVVDPTAVRFNGIEVKQQQSSVPLRSAAKVSTVQEWDRLEDLDVEELLNEDVPLSDTDLLNAVVSLPRRLALMNVVGELPRLSIPPDVEDPDLPMTAAFLATQEGVDTMINRKGDTDPSKNTLDLLLASWTSGFISVFVNFGSLKLQELPYTDKLNGPTPRVTRHATHSFSSCHALLLEPPASAPSRGGLSLSMLSLHGIRQSSPFVNLLLDLQSSLRWVVDYIVRTVLGLREFWTIGQNLPSRFMANINETLEEKESPIDLVTALYQLALTGYCIEPVKEWLIDELAERGYKRWQQAALPAYIKIRQATHDNLLPAIDRASMIVLRLRTLARTPGIPMFEVSEDLLTQMLDHLEVLRIIGHHLLKHCNNEMSESAIFMEWLHNQIQVLGADANSQLGQEAAMKAASLDHSQLLSYITGGLTKSRLNVFLGRQTKFIVEFSRPKNSQVSSSKTILAMLGRHKSESTQPTHHTVELINLLYQALYLRDSYTAVEKAAQDGFVASISAVKDIVLDRGEMKEQMTDMRMLYEVYQGRETFATYVAAVPNKQRNVIRIHRIEHPESLGPPASEGTQAATDSDGAKGAVEEWTATVQSATIALLVESRGRGGGDGGGRRGGAAKDTPSINEIQHIRFFDDDFILVLARSRDHSRLLHIPYSTRLAKRASTAAWALFDTAAASFSTATATASNSGVKESASAQVHIPADPYCPAAAGDGGEAGEEDGEERKSSKYPAQVNELHVWCHHNAVGDFVPLSFEASGTYETKTLFVLDKDGTRFRAGKLASASAAAAAASSSNGTGTGTGAGAP